MAYKKRLFKYRMKDQPHGGRGWVANFIFTYKCVFNLRRGMGMGAFDHHSGLDLDLDIKRIKLK